MDTVLCFRRPQSMKPWNDLFFPPHNLNMGWIISPLPWFNMGTVLSLLPWITLTWTGLHPINMDYLNEANYGPFSTGYHNLSRLCPFIVALHGLHYFPFAIVYLGSVTSLLPWVTLTWAELSVLCSELLFAMLNCVPPQHGLHNVPSCFSDAKEKGRGR